MAKTCQVCGKSPLSGHNVSHAHNITKRRFLPNLQRIKVNVGGTKQRMRVCTRCIRSGQVLKAV